MIEANGERRRAAARRFEDRAYYQTRRRADEGRARAQAFYNSDAWWRLRTAFLQEHPLCGPHRALGRIHAARELDHIIPVLERWDLRLEWSNLQGLCKQLHNAKTMGERLAAARARKKKRRPPRAGDPCP